MVLDLRSLFRLLRFRFLASHLPDNVVIEHLPRVLWLVAALQVYQVRSVDSLDWACSMCTAEAIARTIIARSESAAYTHGTLKNCRKQTLLLFFQRKVVAHSLGNIRNIILRTCFRTSRFAFHH